MEPRTKLQKTVYSLSNKLLGLSKEQKAWAYKNCLDHVGYRTKSGINCLDCGYKFKGSLKVKSVICPACNTRLILKDTKSRKLNQTRIKLALIDVVDGFQVVRIFDMYSYHRAGWKPEQHVSEVVQQWFKPNENLTIVAGTCSFGNTCFTGHLEIRANHSNYWSSNKYDLFVDAIFPNAKCLPIYMRNGFTSKLVCIRPYSFMKTLLTNSRLETLIKANQFGLASHLSGNSSELIHRYWDSIKICIRNKYIVKKPGTWLDYIALLDRFKKDVRNHKYICIKDLDKEHNRLVLKAAEILRRERVASNLKAAEARRLKTAEEQIIYTEEKGRYFGLVFKQGNLTIKVLESIQEFIVEGDLHKHCVFTNEYYKKKDSLCFSASVNGISVETIEVSLKEMKILQSRGLGNKPSEFHDQILALIDKNIRHIKSLRDNLKNVAA